MLENVVPLGFVALALISVANARPPRPCEIYQSQIRDQSQMHQATIFVVVECNGQQQRTQAVDLQQQSWNTQFTFRVQNKQDSVQIKVMREDPYASNQLGQEIAFQEIMLHLLEDQYRKDEWLDLKNTHDGKIGNVRLRAAF